MHKTDFAPVLSATSNLDSVWIISVSQLVPRLETPNGFAGSISLGPVIHVANHFATRLFGRCFPCCFKSRASYYVTVLSLVSTFLAAASTRITQ
jgi:hypothetical protein